MEKRLFKTSLAEFEEAEWTGTNKSGLNPIGDRVLVLPDVSAEMIRGVHLPPDAVARMTMASEAGALVAIGDGAFKWNSDKISIFEGTKPKPGDRVAIERYAGQAVHGKDGKIYRLMDSTSVGAIWG